jgi:hypothetical protein
VKALPAFSGIAAVLACFLVWELQSPTDDVLDIASLRPDAVHASTGANRDVAAGTDGQATPALNPTDIANTLLARPLFSPDRRLAPMARSGPAAADEEIPRLTGIVIGPSGARAIFDDGSGRPKIAAQGDHLGRFKVGTITPGEVSLITPEGARVLRPRFARSTEASGIPMALAAQPAR